MEENKEERYGILSYGRMNPPTIGHLKLVKKVDELSKRYGAGHHIVFSHVHDSNKNPLTSDQKMKYAKLYFPNNNCELSSKKEPGIIQQAARLNKQYDHLHVVAGEDRIPEFTKLLHKYNGKNYNYKTITMHSSGRRNSSGDGVSGMSSSKMRDFAKNGNYKEFVKGIPKHISDKDKTSLYNDVRNGLGIKEEMNLDVLFAEQFSQGYPITPDGGPGDNPDPVKEKQVDWSKVKQLTIKKARKWSGFRSGDIAGTKIGGNVGNGIGPTYDTRYNGATGASGIGDPGFNESIDSPSEMGFLPAYGITGSSKQDASMTLNQKNLQNDSASKSNNKQKWRDFRKSLGVPIG